MRRWPIVGVLVLLAAALVWWWRAPGCRPTRQQPAAKEGPERSAREAAGARPLAATMSASQPARAKLTPEARARLVAALERAQVARGGVGAATPRAGGAGGASGSTAAMDGGALGSLDKEYIRAAIRELVPLVKECYENALRDQPELGGRLTVEFRIAGEPAIGGVVTESRIVETDAGPLHAGLEECVRETMYGLELDAPSGGGTVKVRYPFVFRSR